MAIKRFEQKDIMDLDHDIAQSCDMVYTDPPWGNRMVKWFETDMRKAGYLPPSNTIDQIINRLFELAPQDRPLFCEYGKSGFERVVQIGRQNGFDFIRTIAGTQRSKHPFVIIQFNSDMPKPLEHIHGFDLLKKAMQWHRPKIIFEPFAGLGITSKIMSEFGCDVIANELNPKRAKKFMENLDMEKNLNDHSRCAMGRDTGYS